MGQTARFLQMNGPAVCEAIPIRMGRSSLVAGPAGLFVDVGDIPGSLASLVRDEDRLEVENTEPDAEIILNGRYRKPFGTRVRLRHGDTITVRDVALLYDCPTGAGPTESLTEVVVPTELDTKIVSSQEASQADAMTYMAGVSDPSQGMRRVQTLLRVANTVASGIPGAGGKKAFFGELLSIILSEISAERGVILLVGEGGSMRRVASHPGRHADVSRTIIREVVRGRRAIMARDAQGDERFEGTASIQDLEIRSALCAPIVIHNEVMGIVHLSSDGVSAFDDDQLSLLSAIAGQSAMALENTQLLLKQKQQDRMRSELSLAAEIQQQMVPKTAPDMPGLSVGGRSEMAREVGGDYYDFISTPDRHGLYIYIGDVRGSGLAGGLVLACVRSYFRSLALWAPPPRRILEAVGRFVREDSEGSQQMAVAVLFYDQKRGHFVVCGAGHRPVVVWRAAQRRASVFDLGGIALGAPGVQEGTYAEKGLRLEPGDLVVMYTDGVEKAYAMVGMPQFLKEVEKLAANSSEAQPIVDGLVREAMRVRGGASTVGDQPDDDITVVAVRQQ